MLSFTSILNLQAFQKSTIEGNLNALASTLLMIVTNSTTVLLDFLAISPCYYQYVLNSVKFQLT